MSTELVPAQPLAQPAQRHEVSSPRASELLAVLSDLSAASTLEQGARVVVERAALALGASAGSYSVYLPPSAESRGEAQLELLAARGFAPEMAERWRRYPLSAAGPVAEALREKHLVILHGADDARARYAITDDLARLLADGTLLALPLILDDQPLGVVCLHFAGKRDFDADERAFLDALAGPCARALERARLLATERTARARSEKRLTLSQRLQRVAAALARALTPAEVTDEVLRAGVAAVEATSGSASLIADDGDTVTTVAQVGWDSEHLWRSYSLRASGSPAIEAVETQLPVYVDGPGEWEARFPRVAPAIVAAGIASSAALPLVFGGRVQGLIGFSWHEPHACDDEERALLAALASLCAQALERARLYEAEHRARAEAEAASHAKTEFLATMSHELRTPLNAIAGYVDLLALEIHGPLNEAQQGAVARIRRSQAHLLSLIDEVLNFSRLEAGDVQYDVAAVPLARVLGSVERIMRPSLEARALTVEIEPSAPTLTLWADAGKVEQILVSLLSNAVKFTGDGGRIAVRHAIDGDCIDITVEDTGVGIDAAQLDRIFDPFVQLGRALNAPVEGAGLGLSIARDLAHGMRGTLTVRSDVGKGSAFTLRLPMAAG